jgi:hypothetical protein
MDSALQELNSQVTKKDTTHRRILVYMLIHGKTILEEIRKPWVGGSAAYQRLWELKRRGFDIIHDNYRDEAGHKKKLVYYQLLTPVEKIDFDSLTVRN